MDQGLQCRLAPTEIGVGVGAFGQGALGISARIVAISQASAKQSVIQIALAFLRSTQSPRAPRVEKNKANRGMDMEKGENWL